MQTEAASPRKPFATSDSAARREATRQKSRCYRPEAAEKITRIRSAERRCHRKVCAATKFQLPAEGIVISFPLSKLNAPKYIYCDSDAFCSCVDGAENIVVFGNDRRPLELEDEIF